MPVDLDELLEHVHDEQSFLAFIEALGTDFAQERKLNTTRSPYEAGAYGWENDTIDSFLESASAWAIDSNKCSPPTVAVSNVWQRCAAILLAGKFYE